MLTGALTDAVRPEHRSPDAPRQLDILMCRPTHFAVDYAINPWMDTAVPVDVAKAVEQWEELRATYLRLGHDVRVVDPVPGLPDMVFAANAGVVYDGRVLVSRFTHAERQGESAAYAAWFEAAGYPEVRIATARNEGEGDVLTVGGVMLAAAGTRTTREAHAELTEFFGVPVIGLELVDPRFYHLDTALTVLDERTVAYYPGAFSPASVAVIEQLFPGAIRATEDDACGFGLNAMSDGVNVVMSDRAPHLQERLRERGYRPVGVDMSELVKAGGSAKCCTLELRA